MSAKNSIFSKKIIIIFIVGIFLRLAFVLFVPQIEIGQDAAHYCAIARNIAVHHAYLGIDGKPDVYWAPGYPFFIGTIYTLFGVDNSAVRIIQAILSALIVLLVYYICAKVFNIKIGTLAAVIACVHPGLIGYAGLLLPQLLVAFILVFFVFLSFLSLWVKSNVTTASILGLIAGYAVLIRAELLLLFPVMSALFIYGSENKRKSIKHAIIIFLIMISVVSLWSIRNFKVFGKIIPVSIHFGDTFWISTWKEEWLGWQEKEPFISLREGKDPVEASEAYFKAGIDNIKEHPFIYLKMCAKRLYRLWLTGYSNVFDFMKGSIKDYFMNRQYAVFFIKCMMLIFNVFIVITGFLGIRKAYLIFKDHRELILFLASPIIFTVALHFFIYATPRYAIPEVPFMIVFASAFIYYRLFKKC